MIFSLIKLATAILFTMIVSCGELLIIPFNRGGRLFHALAKFNSHGVLKICGVRLQVLGLEHLDRGSSYIYVANHASYFDIPSVLAGIPDETRIVYKKELERIPIYGWGLRLGKTYIPIERKKGSEALQSLEEAAKKVREGSSVLLFAEGTRSLDGKLQPFKRGAFNLAVRAGVAVVPLTILGSYRVMRKGSFRINPGMITIIVGKPIASPGANGKTAEIQLMEQVHAVIEKNYITDSSAASDAKVD